VSLEHQLSPDQNQIVSAMICIGYQLHYHRNGERTFPSVDLRAALDWTRRVIKSNPEMLKLADWIERECTAGPTTGEPRSSASIATAVAATACQHGNATGQPMSYIWHLKIAECNSERGTRNITAGEDFESATQAAKAYMARAYPNTLAAKFPGPWYPDYEIVGLTRGVELSDDDEDLDGRLGQQRESAHSAPAGREP